MATYSIEHIFLYIFGPVIAFWVVFGISIGLSSIPWREWHRNLAKSPFHPPVIVSLSVWTIFHALMGFALMHSIATNSGESPNPMRFVALIVLAIQLAFAYIWTATYFGVKQIGAACIIGIFHWISVAATLFFFTFLGALQIAISALYLVWVSLEQFLTWRIYKKQKELDNMTVVTKRL